MRRYLPLILLSFFLVVLIVVGSMYLSGGYANKQKPEQMKSINLYTSLPVEQIAALAQEFEKVNKIRVNVMPMTPRELLTRTQTEKLSPKADLILTTKPTLLTLMQAHIFIPYASEQTDIIPTKFKDDNDYWVGAWYDPIIFAQNKDYVKAQSNKPVKWDDLIKNSKTKIGITDFLAAEAFSNLLFTLVSAQGDQKLFDFLTKLHPHVVQYSKFLATPVRMAGMGECDISIAVQSETLRYIQDGFPLNIIYPEDGTAYLLTGIGLVEKAAHAAEAKQFIDWIIQNDAQKVLQNNKHFLLPTNPEIEWVKGYSLKNLILWDNKITKTEEQDKLMDKWVKTVRFAK